MTFWVIPVYLSLSWEVHQVKRYVSIGANYKYNPISTFYVNSQWRSVCNKEFAYFQYKVLPYLYWYILLAIC